MLLNISSLIVLNSMVHTHFAFKSSEFQRILQLRRLSSKRSIVMSSKSSGKKETLSKQSAAQFFSEHQQIAGFDNPGKSLFTTIREFVENSLDAAESMHVLPEIELCVEEFSEAEHNELNGIRSNAASSTNLNAKDEDADEEKPEKPVKATKASKDTKEGKDQMYYLIRCTDNGCGIPEENIGDMLGRVLSGSKHGIRQTRGKFGLGAKMALIWSKKSSGLPIHIRTAHSPNAHTAPATISTTTLDIDIYRNEPRILKRHSSANPESWRGTEISVTIAGNWGNYRSRVLQYFQQLAVITPYAKLSVDFKCHRDAKKSFRADFDRRSEQMPPIAQEIDPHPKSLNNITLSNLLQARGGSNSLEKFLVQDLSGITPAVAARLTASLELSGKLARALGPAQVAALIQALRDEKQIKPPSGACLSPAGEYNMRLGVLKELKPKMVATFSDKAGAHEGHPFLVEAAISLGGSQVREGINVYRFANRIPLLFEAGADVVTQVATKSIKWGSYHIDPKKDNIGVYVSIVSTKIPFKGTSKEYVGEDVTEMFQSVKRALQGCCQQLRVNLAKHLALKEEAERRKTLVKYIPNITKALFSVLQKMETKRGLNTLLTTTTANTSTSSSTTNPTTINTGSTTISSSTEILTLLQQVSASTLTETTLSEHLHRAVDKYESEAILQSALGKDRGESGKRQRVYLVPDTRLWGCPLVVGSGSSGGGAGGGSGGVVDLTESQYTEVSLTQDSAVSGVSVGIVSGGSSRKRTLSQMSRANTADTTTSAGSGVFNIGANGSGGSGKHRWLTLTLNPVVSGGASASNNAAQVSQTDSAPAAAAISAYILI